MNFRSKAPPGIYPCSEGGIYYSNWSSTITTPSIQRIKACTLPKIKV